MQFGWLTAIAVPAVFVATVMGVMVFDPSFATYAFVPSGVKTAPSGLVPTVIAVPAVSVVRLTGVTVPDPLLATYAFVPSGEIAIAAGPETAIVELVAFVAVLRGVKVLEP